MPRLPNILITAIVLSVAMTGGASSGANDEPASTWHRDYSEAVVAAKSSHKLLLIQFHAPEETARDRQLAERISHALSEPNRRDRFVVARLPIDFAIDHDEKPERLLQHAAFAEMHGRPGLTIVDFTDPASGTFHHVVSIYPLAKQDEIRAEHLAVLLDLPAGTLTQRTLIFAVRTHAESPASTAGEWHPVLVDEAHRHASHQAKITLQGHHNWQNRFERINTKLPTGLLAQEVCAESWPGQELLEAARECVHSWRQSSGHWDAVKSRHPIFGYDMQRGANGVWYATGIFGRPH